MPDSDFSLPPPLPPVAPAPVEPPTVEQTYGYPLFDSDGEPSVIDVNQDSLANCYFAGSLMGLANGQPETIKNAMQFNPEDSSFDVTMYVRATTEGRGGVTVEARVVHVTKEEIQDNIQRGGGSVLDNGDTGYSVGMWPAVLETAYAKMNDSNPADGLDEGYQRIANGGKPADALFTLTGVVAPTFALSDDKLNQDAAFKLIEHALHEGRPIVLGTGTEALPAKPGEVALELPHDGLADHHAYVVSKIYRDENGVAQVELMNPLGHNRSNGGEAEPSDDYMITVPLSQLYAGVGDTVTIGARPGEVGAGSVNAGSSLPVASTHRPGNQIGSAPTEPFKQESTLEYLTRRGVEWVHDLLSPPPNLPPPLPKPPPGP
jgi:hypothetical protein